MSLETGPAATILTSVHPLCENAIFVRGCKICRIHIKQFGEVLWARRRCCMQMHLGMVAVMNAAIDFEDCFTTEGVDGVYCSEPLYEVEMVSIPAPVSAVPQHRP